MIQAAYDKVDSIHLAFIDAKHPAAPGDVLMLDAANLFGSEPPVPASSVHISVGGVDHVATSAGIRAPVRTDLQPDQNSVHFSFGLACLEIRRSGAAAGDRARGHARFRTLYDLRHPASAGHPAPSTQK